MIASRIRRGFTVDPVRRFAQSWKLSDQIYYPPKPILATFTYLFSTPSGFIGINEQGYIIKSTDGSYWSFHTELADHLVSINYGTIRKVGWSGTHLIVLTLAVNGSFQCSSSTDGVTWTTTTPPLWSVERVVTADNKLLVIGGHSGLSGNPLVVFSVTNGASWPYVEGIATALNGDTITGADYAGDKLFIGTSSNRALMWSSDFITWGAKNFALSYAITRICKTPTHYVYGGYWGYMGQSADLVTFSSSSGTVGWGTGTAKQVQDMHWHNDTLYVLSYEGIVARFGSNPIMQSYGWNSELSASLEFKSKPLTDMAFYKEILVIMGGFIAVSPSVRY